MDWPLYNALGGPLNRSLIPKRYVHYRAWPGRPGAPGWLLTKMDAHPEVLVAGGGVPGISGGGVPGTAIGIGIPNPISIVEDIGGGILDAAGWVGHGLANVAAYGVSSVGDAVSFSWHEISHPGEIPGQLVEVLQHPGMIAKPAAFAALLTLGPVGLTYAYAMDRTGVTDAIGHAIDMAGGIYMQVFFAACNAVSMIGGMPELALGCLIMSVAYDVAIAIANKDINRLVFALEKIAFFALQYGIPLEDLLNSLMDSVFRVVGKDFDRIFGGLDKVQDGLSHVFNDEIAGKITGKIRAAAPQIEAKIRDQVLHLPETAVGSLNKAIGVTNTPKVNGTTALNTGLRTGPVGVPRGGIDTILPVAPGVARKYMRAINALGQAMGRPNSPQAVVFDTNAALSITRPEQMQDLVSVLDQYGAHAVLSVRNAITGPDVGTTAAFWNALMPSTAAPRQKTLLETILSFFGL